MAVTWGADTALTTQTAINDTVEEFLGTIDLSAGLAAHIQLEIDNESGSFTNGVLIACYATVDLTSEVFDDIPFFGPWLIEPVPVTLERWPLIISGVYKFRIGAIADGATDDYTCGGDYRVRLT